MLRHAPPGVQVKAAGGIRDFDSLVRVRSMGVTRVGATRTAAMLNECRKRLQLDPIPFQNDDLAMAQRSAY